MGELGAQVSELINKTTLNPNSPIVFVDSSGCVLSDEKIRFYTDRVLDLAISELNRKPDLIKCSIILKNLTDIKKAFHPAIQKNVNTNVNVFDNHLQKWLEARKQLPDTTDEQIKIEIAQSEQTENQNANA